MVQFHFPQPYKGWYTQKIIAIILVVCLLSCLTTSASAVDIYSTTPEAEPLLKSSDLMSTYNSGISTAAVEPSDLESYLKYNTNTVAQYLWAINYFLTGNNYALVESPSLSTLFSNLLNVFDSSINGSVGYNIKSIYDFLDDVLNNNGTYLTSNGVVSSVYSNSISNFVRNGFLGLSTNIKAVTSAIQALNFNDYSTILNSIYSSVDGLESGFTSANTAIGGVTTAVNNVRTAVNDVRTAVNDVRTAVNDVVSGLSTVNTSILSLDSNLISILTVPAGTSFWGADGNVTSSSSVLSLSNLLRVNFLGLRRYLTALSGWTILGSSGNATSITSDVGFSTLVNNGFLGLRNFLNNSINAVDGSVILGTDGVTYTPTGGATLTRILVHGIRGISANIKGNAWNNIYKSILYDNNNSITSVNSTGLGPLLNTQLSSIGENLGHLAYVFASDEDIKLREDSQPLLDSTDSFYDDSDSNVKISTNNVGSLKDIAGNFTSIIDADADIGDAFAVVSNSNTYRWFSADVAMNLDSLGVATVDFEESTYDRLHREFNEIYFPDRVGGGN